MGKEMATANVHELLDSNVSNEEREEMEREVYNWTSYPTNWWDPMRCGG